jgi:hypothetical protein
MKGERAARVCVSSSKLSLRTPWEETRGWPTKPEAKGQEAPGEGSGRAETPKSTYFELAIGPVCELQGSSRSNLSRARTSI